MNGSPLQFPDFSTFASAEALAPQLAAVAALIVGLSLWCVGRKTLRAATCVMGAILGVLIAGRFSPHFPAGAIGGFSHSTIALIVGGALGVVAAVAFYRVVMAGLGAGTFGTAAILVSMVCLGVALPIPTKPAPTPSPIAANNAASTPSFNLEELTAGLPDDVRKKLTEALGASKDGQAGALGSLDTLRHVAASQQAAASETWAAMGSSDRSTVLSAGLVAGLVGLLMGAIAPVRTAAFITALAGSAMWTGALGWLIRKNNLPGAELIDQPASVLLVAWGIITLVGIKIQLAAVNRESAPQPQATPAPAHPRPV